MSICRTHPKLIEVLHRNAQDGVEAVCARSVPPNTGDFQLMSRCVIEFLPYLPESHGFLRGFVAVLGSSKRMSSTRGPRDSRERANTTDCSDR